MSGLTAFAWACLLIELTPGPNMTYLAVLTLDKGRRAGLAAVAGVASGLAVIGALAALGIGAVIAASPALWSGLRIAGFVYLVWLAWETWRGAEGPDAAAHPRRDNQHAVMRAAFRDGLVTNLLNPKAALFYVAVLPLSIDQARPVTRQALVLAALYVAIATAVHLAIVLLAARARPAIAEAEHRRLVRAVFAVMLLAIAAWMLWATRR